MALDGHGQTGRLTHSLSCSLPHSFILQTNADCEQSALGPRSWNPANCLSPFLEGPLHSILSAPSHSDPSLPPKQSGTDSLFCPRQSSPFPNLGCSLSRDPRASPWAAWRLLEEVAGWGPRAPSCPNSGRWRTLPGGRCDTNREGQRKTAQDLKTQGHLPGLPLGPHHP